MNRWEQLQELFESTVELDASERARVLHERTHGDSELIASVEALVASHASPAEGLDLSATQVLLQLKAESPAAELLGLEFDGYRLDDHLASGGMAHVYRATRMSAGTERRVALKVLRPSLDTAAFLERFQRERETLAALEHEHIVTFLDAGALPDGRPYLVMEYIEGLPLSQWGRSVAQPQRIALFLQVLAAVQYAHRQLVVHRDLKPSNVLVTKQGVPKLLDFGVALALGVEGNHSQAGGPLTPAYASPEQLRGEAITTSTDIYSLGVLLRELLSADTSEPAAAPVKVSADLEAIIARALSEDPFSRYRSVDHFADDLRRERAHEPISARPGTWAYRAALAVRRHRFALGLGGALLLATLTGWIASDLARRRAEAEASTGWGAHAEVKTVARIYEEWLTGVASDDPELFAAATAHLEASLGAKLEAHPETETLVRLTLAELYLGSGAGHGDRERAGVHIERAWKIAQTTRGLGWGDRKRIEALRERVRAGE